MTFDTDDLWLAAAAGIALVMVIYFCARKLEKQVQQQSTWGE